MTMELDNQSPPRSRGQILRSVFRQPPTKPGQTYGVPGEGNTIRISIVAVAVVLAVWQIVTASGLIAPLFLPSPVAVLEKFVSLLQNGFTNTPLLQHIAVSAARVFAAFTLACVIGIPLGLAMGMSPVMRGLFDPFLEFYRPIPPLAYLPLMIIWFGIGETSKILLIFLSVLAPVALGARPVSGRWPLNASMPRIRWVQPALRCCAMWFCHLPSRKS